MKIFFGFTFALTLAACGGGGSGSGITDLSGPHTVPAGDLAMQASTDMAKSSTGSAGCHATIACENQCITTGGGSAAEMTCITACDSMETSSGMQLESALKTCVQTACPQQPEDLGTTSPCAYDPSSGMYINQMGCSQCLMTAQAMGGSCYSANQACNADM